MSQSTATVIAAGIALLASFASLVLTARSARGAEARAAHRKILEPALQDLGEAIHSVLATANVMLGRRRKGQDVKAWVDAGESAASTLKALRPRLKYPLYGLDEALRTLSRVPAWTATYDGHPSADQLILSARKLAVLTDKAIARSYASGEPPGIMMRLRARRSTNQVRECWNDRFGPHDPEGD